MSNSDQQSTFLQAWDNRVRQYAEFFEVHRVGAREDLSKLQSSPFTNWKNVTKREDRYQKIDSLELRRQLGEITDEEVSEVNRVFGGNPVTGYLLTRSRSEPALLQAWHKFEGLAFLSAGAAFGAYGRFVKGFNNLWLLAPVVPFMTWQLTQRSRQPATLIDNAYRYLIAKRAATAEFEANQARLIQNQWAQSPQFASL